MTKNWFNETVDETVKCLETDEEKGLNSSEVESRKEKYGLNELAAKKKKSTFVKFLEQFKDFMIIVLIISAVISGIVGVKQEGISGITDTVIILVVVIVNAIIGVLQENKAEKSLEALQKLSSHVAKVIRNGKLEVVQSRELVPGDIVILETGDYVPADLRIIEAVNLKAQESALTGESVPVEKMAARIEDERIGLGDRINMLFSSSLITYGRGKAVVVETGMNTEVGKIADIINSAEEGETPLQGKLNKLGKTLGIVALIICFAIFGIGLLYGKDVIEMFLTAVSLAVAAIPEGLPAVSTIVLAIGVQRMVKKNAIVKKLPAVETLGSATVICSDKTGTLTQNKMTVEKIYYNNKLHDVKTFKRKLGDEDLNKLIYTCMLCNDTKITENDKLAGDPTETALVDLGFKLDYEGTLYGQYPRIKEIPFDSDRKLMSTVHNVNGVLTMITKGAADILLDRMNLTDSEKSAISEITAQLSAQGLRLLAFAYKEIESADISVKNESDLTFMGLIAMMDPPREESKAAVAECISAGIKPVMITGDHKVTAAAIAKEIGILKDYSEAAEGSEIDSLTDEQLKEYVPTKSVYARVSPEHKIRIVKAWQERGNIVAMTGDGVNDAPALKQADIGVAMGITGTEVSKDAASMVLADDNFATIVKAVNNGRNIYANIKRSIQFLLSGNTAGILVVLFASIFALPVPFAAVHLLFINLLTDSLPAIALGLEPHTNDVMKEKPRPINESILTKSFILSVMSEGLIIAAASAACFLFGLQTSPAVGSTMAFASICLSRLIHGFNCKSDNPVLFTKKFFNNKFIFGAFGIGVLLLALVLFVPAVSTIFKAEPLNIVQIIMIAATSIGTLILIQLIKFIKKSVKK